MSKRVGKKAASVSKRVGEQGKRVGAQAASRAAKMAGAVKMAPTVAATKMAPMVAAAKSRWGLLRAWAEAAGEHAQIDPVVQPQPKLSLLLLYSRYRS